MRITEMEKRVLTALYESSKGNGHDFGLVEECRSAVDQPRQLAGIMSSLTQKGLVTIHGEVTTDSGSWTQTTWKVELKEIEEILGVAACDACNKTYQRDPKDCQRREITTMRVYGNLMNRLSESANQAEPKVGDGATINGYTDRQAGTIIEVCTPKKIKVQYDTATRTDKNGMSETQDYSYERDPEGPVYVFTKRKNGMWIESKGTSGLTIGVRRQYHDFSF